MEETITGLGPANKLVKSRNAATGAAPARGKNEHQNSVACWHADGRSELAAQMLQSCDYKIPNRYNWFSGLLGKCEAGFFKSVPRRL
jgi:hypothetical protein